MGSCEQKGWEEYRRPEMVVMEREGYGGAR